MQVEMSDLSEEVESLQNMLIAQATGHSADNAEYVRLRQLVLAQPMVEELVPRFLRTCRDSFQFWQFIKYEYGSYRERREFLWKEFRPILELLERGGPTPSDGEVTAKLETVDAAHVQAAWSKALDRRNGDPEGAITAARTLLESVCKHILDGAQQSYDDGADLPQLYKKTAEFLNLAPSQHTEKIFKQILGGCAAVVEGLGAMRNKLSDSHGKGRSGVKPAPRHAELAVNLAGATAAFLLATWTSRNEAA
jgi:hypothetical protein